MHRVHPTAATLEDILNVQRRAASLTGIPPAHQFTQSVLWAQDAEAYADADQAMAAHRQAVTLASDVAWIGMNVVERQLLLEQMSGAMIRAVTFAISQSQNHVAMAWADQIRSILWRQSMHVRTVLDNVGAEQRSALAGLASLRDSRDAPGVLPDSANAEREQRRAAAHSTGSALVVPSIDPRVYENLHVPGTLVSVVPGTEGATALVVGDAIGTQTVHLPKAGIDELDKQVASLRAALGSTSDRSGAWSSVERRRHALFDCFEWLWDCVVGPIVDCLPHHHGQELARIWWSPIGQFALLPLHAAGRHPRSSRQIARANSEEWPCLADIAISAYLPTVWSLDVARSSNETSAVKGLLYLATDSIGGIKAIPAEYQAVSDSLPSIPITPLLDADVTVDAVREAITRHRYLHVTAHGHLDENSVESGIRLRDGTFTLGELADGQVPGGELAVLLSCDSASGDVRLPNEALHLAGAARQAGYREVVAATMPLRDSSTIPVVNAIYSTLNRASQHRPGDAIVRAMHQAVDSLRRGRVTALDPLSWAPYAFFGWGLAHVDVRDRPPVDAAERPIHPATKED
ncbi:hypothetical protein BFL43_04300 [Williamsia sp. 1135]|nr:hypothetical protein BFL43_04300 [Williamsia sp. 1135]